MNTVLPILLIFTALAAPAGSPPVAAADPLRFGQTYCPYTVEFPAAPSQTETPSPDGSKFVAAELLLQGVRLSAFCAADAPQPVSQNATPQPAPSANDRAARIASMISMMGISNYAIADAGPAAPDCSEVEGTIDANGTPYRIVSALCFETATTFIAEAVFSADTDRKIAQNFLGTVHPVAQPAGNASTR
jgi:hypothetical protein